MEAYIQAEQNCIKLRDLLRQSELRRATLEAQIATQRPSKAGVHPNVTKDQDQINRLGRQFAVLHEPWLGFNITKAHATSRPNVDPNSFTRYATSAVNQEAMQAELVDFIPDHLRKTMGFGGFEQLVSFFASFL